MNKIIANSALNIKPEDYSLLTDLDRLTMTACYAGKVFRFYISDSLTTLPDKVINN